MSLCMRCGEDHSAGCDKRRERIAQVRAEARREALEEAIQLTKTMAQRCLQKKPVRSADALNGLIVQLCALANEPKPEEGK